MSFKKTRSVQRVPDSPLALFNDLRPRKIEALYDQQAQILRRYTEEANSLADVAIQAATGSGKTLIGLLIAEWRRRRGERVVYLCPTRQLVHQVARFSNDQLGIAAYPFTGRSAGYPQAERTKWKRGDILGIAPYSALFNINPFFNDPNFIVIDDAHAADQYISEYWTVRVTRQDYPALFDAIAHRLSDALPGDELYRLIEHPGSLGDQLWVQLVPAPAVWRIEDEITTILDQAPAGSDLDFRWRVLKGSLRACQLFVSPHEMIFRPVLPPTSRHVPFQSANQRLYMSATLGRGGELERLSGRKSILRLPAPAGWDGHGVGRRFFLFPKAVLDESDTENLIWKLCDMTGRALFLVRDDKTSREYQASVARSLPHHRIFLAREIEESKDPFIQSEKAVAIIANRYDGIDFPQNECRLLIVDGSPTGASLQERFLSEKLGASVLFSERVRTRIVQAFGRCTRSATDYALIIVADEKLMNELMRRETKLYLHRELQAEIAFGEEQSDGASEEQFLSYAQLFFQQGDDWRSAEGEISSLRDQMTEEPPPALMELAEAASQEIEYVESMWGGDYDRAIDAAEQVLTALSGGAVLKGYRAMWHYLAGCAAQLSSEARGETSSPRAMQHFTIARSLAGVRWLGRLQTTSNDQEVPGASKAEDNSYIERLETELCEMGFMNDRKLAKREAQVRAGLSQEEAEHFEACHVELGNLLGFQSKNSDSKGAPDPWWIAGDGLCFVFEDHSKSSHDKPLPLEKARQAAGHPNWIRRNIKLLSDNAEIIPVLITACDVSSREVQTALQGVSVWPLEEFRSWVNDVFRTIRVIRSKLPGPGDLVWRAEALSDLGAISATPSSLRDMLLRRRVP